MVPVFTFGAAADAAVPYDDADLVVIVEDATVRRGNSRLLHGVSWWVAQDERWVVLGPNGAGKTTLLNLAAARLFPTSGTVRVLGETLGRVDVNELRTRIGLTTVALHDRIPPDEVVLDVVRTAAWGVVGRFREEYHSLDTQRARDLLEQLGATALRARRYGTLSEGERKRVQIARALMTDPELLLLDEPAAGLDLGGREDLVRRLSLLAADPHAPAMVLVTHHVEEIPVGFDHALLLRQGSVVAQGPIRAVLTSENLSATFDAPLQVSFADGRFAARAA
ncbi:MAG TPA: ABC transporter ATP-binding protein [Micromonosporaceae bacterium]|jgi:iron complex transport system ATP-binding protein